MPSLKCSLVSLFTLVMALPLQAQNGTSNASNAATGAAGVLTAQTSAS